MSTMDLSFLLTRAEHSAMAGVRATPLRIVLLAGEAISLPRASTSLRVLAGTAWLTCGGSDVIFPMGHSVALGGSKQCAVISPVGGQPVLVEVS